MTTKQIKNKKIQETTRLIFSGEKQKKNVPDNIKAKRHLIRFIELIMLTPF